jgi:predicted RNA-binding protein with PUA-like domain
MVTAMKKVSLTDQVGHETEDGSGERYNDSSDGSEGADTANVSDFDDGDPKAAPDECYFGSNECRKVVNKGDVKLGIERVCGTLASSCTRAYHGEKNRRVGPPGVYVTIKTQTKVDGILSTHRTKKEAFAQNLVEARAMQDSRLSILPNSPSYVEVVTGTSKDSDIESTGSDKEDYDTFADLDNWETLGADVAKGERKPAAKGPPSKTRHFTPSDLTTKSPTPDGDAVTQALLTAVLSLKDKVESMEPWTKVEAKKNKAKDEETDASDAEEDAGSTKGRRKEKARAPA